jgi:ribosomal protein S18 acetylase RimI-like enzyme
MANLERGEPKVRIRPMEHEDIDSVLAIDQRITGERRAITYTELITGDLGGVLALSFVAEVDGVVQGFLLARRMYIVAPPSEVGLIQILGVDPDYQRKGIATKMVNALLDTCRQKKLNGVRIMINERDSQLVGLFEHLGFRRGELIDYTKSLK